MALADDLQTDVSKILTQTWAPRNGQVVPNTSDVALEGGAVRLNATVLYADLAGSTEIAMWDKRVAARLFKAFLATSTRIIRHRNGQVRSFDGDRVMGVFVGDSKNTSAAKCALNIKWVMDEVIRPKFSARYDAFSKGTYSIKHCVGIDTSEIYIVRAGIRNNNDLVWVGRAPNVAAKLSDFRNAPYVTYISEAVYSKLNTEVKMSNGNSMWEPRTWTQGPISSIHRSKWRWKP